MKWQEKKIVIKIKYVWLSIQFYPIDYITILKG